MQRGLKICSTISIWNINIDPDIETNVHVNKAKNKCRNTFENLWISLKTNEGQITFVLIR